MKKPSEDNFYALTPRILLEGKLSNGKRLSMGARVLLCLIISYKGVKELYASQATLGSQIGVTRTMISRYLKELVDADYIIKIHRGKGKTCILILHDRVYQSIERCKRYYTQETITKNKCVSGKYLKESNELVELFEVEMHFQPEKAEREEWITCFGELLCHEELTHGRLILVIDFISNNEFWKKRIYTPLQLRDKDEYGVILAIRFWRESIKIKGDF